MDYAVEQCLDDDNNQRCSKPFLVTKATCYDLSWTTDGAISHTTAEVRDAGSNEIVYYRDTDGEWTPEKGEVSSTVGGRERVVSLAHASDLQLVYLDFKPKVWGQGNKTVDYTVKTCA
jgi:hypothetical protein